MDGWITIGTKLDTKDLERELRKAQNELMKFNREAENLTEQKAKIDIDLQPYMKERQEIIKNNKNINERKFKLEALKEQYKELLSKEVEIGDKLDENAMKQEKVTTKIKELNSQLQKSRGIDNLKSSIDNISNKMSKIIKKAIKWGLAIFSIRSAYSFLRGSISIISQYNQQIATNIEYIRWALAMTLKPVVEYIINLAYKLLGILRAVIKYLFNYDIFANAGADAFMKAKKSTEGVSGNLGKATKQAKELNKQLASFDEMNILGDNTKMAGDTGASGGTSGAGGGIPIPTEIPDIELKFKVDWNGIYDAIDKIIDWAKNKVKDLFDDLSDKWTKKGEELGGVLGEISKVIGDFFKNVGEFVSTAIDGIGRIFKGLVKIVQSIFEGDIKGVIKGALDVILGIFEAGISGVGLMFNALLTPIKAVFNATIEIVKETIADIKERFAKIKEWFGNLNIGAKWDNMVTGLGNVIDKIKKKIKDLKTWISNTFKNIGTAIGNVFKNAFKTIFNKLASAIESRLNSPINAINSMIGVINKLLPKKKELTKLKTIKLPRLAKGGIVNMPSRGIPVGNAIAGERGAEGVIPLTDSQQMALLGEAIGKYITVNANITNNMNGRVISRELQKIQNDNNFAYNR